MNRHGKKQRFTMLEDLCRCHRIDLAASIYKKGGLFNPLVLHTYKEEVVNAGLEKQLERKVSMDSTTEEIAQKIYMREVHETYIQRIIERDEKLNSQERDLLHQLNETMLRVKKIEKDIKSIREQREVLEGLQIATKMRVHAIDADICETRRSLTWKALRVYQM